MRRACSTWSTDAVAGDRRDFAVQSALSRAVETERLAIDRHEAAARRLDQLAAEMEGHAPQDRDEQLQERAIELAAVARERAQSARDRAAAALQRLHEEGFDPGGGVDPAEASPAGAAQPREQHCDGCAHGRFRNLK